jgi:hypothetical protein
VRITIGLGLATASILSCSGGVLDVGRSDGGDGTGIPVPEVSVFSAASVAKARSLGMLLGPDNRWTSYAQADLRADLVGGWLLCYWRSVEDKRSFQFTADGHWYTLVDDGDGGLKRGQLMGADLPSPGYDGGAIGYEGTYSFQDLNGNPSGPGGPAVYVATHDVTWFHPEFTGPLMSMSWATDGSQDTCVLIEP